MSQNNDQSIKEIDPDVTLSRKSATIIKMVRWVAAWIVSVATVPVCLTGWIFIEQEQQLIYTKLLDHLFEFLGMAGFLSMFCLIPATLGLLVVAVLRAVWGWQHIAIWVTLGAVITAISILLLSEGGNMPTSFLIVFSIGGAVAAALAWMVVFAGRRDRRGRF